MSRIWRVITAALSCPVWVPKKRPSPLCVLALDPSSGHLTRTSVFLCHFQSSNSEYTGFLAPLCHWTPFCRPQDGWELGGRGQWAVPGILTDPKICLFWYAGCAIVHCAHTLDSSPVHRASKSVFLAGGSPTQSPPYFTPCTFLVQRRLPWNPHTFKYHTPHSL